MYAPTKRGHRELAASLARPDWASVRVAQPIATWLGLSIHLTQRGVATMLAARLQFLTKELARERDSLIFIKTLSSRRAKAGEAIVTLVIRQLEVEIVWVRELIKTKA